MKVLVTGADGFVGRWLVRRLLADGREVYGAVRPGQSPPAVPPAARMPSAKASPVARIFGQRESRSMKSP